MCWWVVQADPMKGVFDQGLPPGDLGADRTSPGPLSREERGGTWVSPAWPPISLQTPLRPALVRRGRASLLPQPSHSPSLPIQPVNSGHI